MKKHPENNADKNQSPPLATPALAMAATGGLAEATAGPSMTGPVNGVGLAAMVVLTENENLNHVADDTYWREQHASQPFAIGESYESFEPAYRVGYEACARWGDRNFEEVEEKIQHAYQTQNRGIPWGKARSAARAAWDRVAAREIIEES